MPEPYFSINGWTFQTYTVTLAVALVTGGAAALYRARHLVRLSALVDVYLAGWVGGVLLARVGHVLLNWDFFAYNQHEIFSLSAGGLDWHGAVIGALVAAHWMAVRRAVALGPVYDSLVWMLPFLALAGWFGCGAARCAYGAEVGSMADYPAWLVFESQDIFGIYAPRFNTPLIGMGLAGGLLLVAVVFRPRWWIVLALFAGGMFGLGFLRGDYALVWLNLRADQWLDLGIGLWAAWGAWRSAN